MYLFLALVWLIVGVLVQVFWTSLQPIMRIPIDRTLVGIIIFVLFIYNFIRWRLARMRVEQPTKPRFPTRIVEGEYDPNLDFSKEEPRNEPPR